MAIIINVYNNKWCAAAKTIYKYDSIQYDDWFNKGNSISVCKWKWLCWNTSRIILMFFFQPKCRMVKTLLYYLCLQKHFIERIVELESSGRLAVNEISRWNKHVCSIQVLSDYHKHIDITIIGKPNIKYMYIHFAHSNSSIEIYVRLHVYHIQHVCVKCLLLCSQFTNSHNERM